MSRACPLSDINDDLIWLLSYNKEGNIRLVKGIIVMNPTLYQAVVVVTCALVFYSIAVIQAQRNASMSRRTLAFLTAGITCDCTSTGLMIAGSRHIPITVHGFIGYSALALMLIDTILIWKVWYRNRIKVKDGAIDIDANPEIPKSLHIYTRIAYGWWLAAYIAGAIISITLKS